MTSPLHDQPLLPHLIVRSLAAHDDAPCIHLAGRVASYAIASRDPATGEPTLLVTLDLTFRGDPVAWTPGLNDRFVTVHRVGDDVRLELASGP